jgi:hypothetical protein
LQNLRDSPTLTVTPRGMEINQKTQAHGITRNGHGCPGGSLSSYAKDQEQHHRAGLLASGYKRQLCSLPIPRGDSGETLETKRADN